MVTGHGLCISSALESYNTEQAWNINEEMISILLAPLFLEDVEPFSYGGRTDEWFPPVPPHAWPKKTLKDPTFLLSLNKAIPS